MKPAANVFGFALFFLAMTGFPEVAMGKTEFRVFRVEVDMEDEKTGVASKDIYISGGKADGVRESMVLNVFRPKTVHDYQGRTEHQIRILVGQLKVIRALENVAIARIRSIDSSTSRPILTYRTVMVGDIAVPGKKRKMAFKKRSGTPKASNKLSTILPSSVLFGFGKWQLNERGVEALSRVQARFDSLSDHDLSVVGHTCDLGPSEYNRDLSMRRAQSVADHLIENGISRNQVHVAYYGESSPMVPNETEEERRKNRRVEIRFEPSGQS